MRQALVPHATASPLQRGIARGFTLIEVMIVVAIVAILAAVAIPSYRDYILRGQLVDATTLLAATRADMERYYQDNRRYSAVGGFTPPCVKTQGSFNLSCSFLSDTQFTLLAQGFGAATGFSYSIDQSDNRRTVTLGSSWPVPNPATCWVVKRGQTCN